MVFAWFVCVIILWSRVPNFLNGKCKRLSEEAHFVQKKCMSIPSGLFEAPHMNSCLTMLTYHYAFGHKDARLEDLVVDKV
jgi:hypothetical protein